MSDSEGIQSPDIGMPMAAGSDKNSGVLAGSPGGAIVDPSFAGTTVSSQDALEKQIKPLLGIADDGRVVRMATATLRTLLLILGARPSTLRALTRR